MIGLRKNFGGVAGRSNDKNGRNRHGHRFLSGLDGVGARAEKQIIPAHMGNF